LHPVYARDEAHARVQAQPWLARQAHLPNVDVRAYPSGFLVVRQFLPGTVTARAEDIERGRAR